MVTGELTKVTSDRIPYGDSYSMGIRYIVPQLLPGRDLSDLEILFTGDSRTGIGALRWDSAERVSLLGEPDKKDRHFFMAPRGLLRIYRPDDFSCPLLSFAEANFLFLSAINHQPSAITVSSFGNILKDTSYFEV